MKKFSIFSAILDTPEREQMLGTYDRPAKYGDYYLFAMTYEELFGEQTDGMVDISNWVLVDEIPNQENQIEGEVYRTYAEFDMWAQGMMQQEHTGIQLVMNESCAKRLQATEFDNKSEQV